GSLRSLHLQGHAPGRHLELDRELTDAVERRAVGGALQVEAVAGSAVGLEQLLAVFDRERGGRRRVVGCRHRGGGAGVYATGEQEAEPDQGGRCPRTAATVRAARL